jgi:hypothetical protein
LAMDVAEPEHAEGCSSAAAGPEGAAGGPDETAPLAAPSPAASRAGGMTGTASDRSGAGEFTEDGTELKPDPGPDPGRGAGPELEPEPEPGPEPEPEPEPVKQLHTGNYQVSEVQANREEQLKVAIKVRDYDKARQIQELIAQEKDNVAAATPAAARTCGRCCGPDTSSEETDKQKEKHDEDVAALKKKWVEPLKKREEEACKHANFELAARLKVEVDKAEAEVERRAEMLRGAPNCFIDPDGVFRAHWDQVQVAALFYVAILVPLRVGFSLELELLSFSWWVELVVDIYFITDICLNRAWMHLNLFFAPAAAASQPAANC